MRKLYMTAMPLPSLLQDKFPWVVLLSDIALQSSCRIKLNTTGRVVCDYVAILRGLFDLFSGVLFFFFLFASEAIFASCGRYWSWVLFGTEDWSARGDNLPSELVRQPRTLNLVLSLGILRELFQKHSIDLTNFIERDDSPLQIHDFILLKSSSQNFLLHQVLEKQ